MSDNEDHQTVEVTVLGRDEPLTLIWEWRRFGRVGEYRGEWFPFLTKDKRTLYIRRDAIVAFQYFGSPYGGRA